MDGRLRRAAGASLVALAVLALAPAAQAAGVGVTSLSSLPAGAKAGNLTGVVTNDSDGAAKAKVSVRVMRGGTGGALIGTASVDVAAHSAKSFLVDVKVPSSLKKGTYYVSACTPQGGADEGKLGCATSAADLKIKGGDPLQGKLATKAFDARARRAPARRTPRRRRPARPGARTLSQPGNRVWPELGNGGYKSLHTDVFTVYDAVTNKFLPGQPRRAHAAGDAVPVGVQPRLRPQEQHLEHGGDARPGHDDLVDHDRRRPGDVRAQAADLRRRSQRAGRSGPARAPGLQHQPGLGHQPEPARLRADQQQRVLAGRAVR